VKYSKLQEVDQNDRSQKLLTVI